MTLVSAMSNEGPVVVAIVFPFALAITAVVFRAILRGQKMNLIAKALESGNIDDETRRALVHNLAPQRSEWLGALAQHLTWLCRNLLFVGGWITMFTGLGVLVGSQMFGWGRSEAEGGMVASFVGFGLVTLPLALRELARRNPADQPR